MIQSYYIMLNNRSWIALVQVWAITELPKSLTWQSFNMSSKSELVDTSTDETKSGASRQVRNLITKSTYPYLAMDYP